MNEATVACIFIGVFYVVIVALYCCWDPEELDDE